MSLQKANIFMRRWLASRPLTYNIMDSADTATLLALVAAYGAACAAQERARCAVIAEQYRYPHGPADDEHRGAYIMRDYIAAAIRATPGEPG